MRHFIKIVDRLNEQIVILNVNQITAIRYSDNNDTIEIFTTDSPETWEFYQNDVKNLLTVINRDFTIHP